jgi:hypothetical protein
MATPIVITMWHAMKATGLLLELLDVDWQGGGIG